MPFRYEFAFHPAVAQLTASGAPNLAEWRIAMGALIRHPDLPIDAPLLCDLRSVRGMPRSRHGRTVVQEWLQFVPTRRVAFVAGTRTASRIASELWTESRDRCEVFTEYERALRWLAFDGSRRRAGNCSRTRQLSRA